VELVVAVVPVLLQWVEMVEVVLLVQVEQAV
jgi:hypothetical protein